MIQKPIMITGFSRNRLLLSTTMDPEPETFKTLRPISRFFTKESISLLQTRKIINLSDFISLMFLMCPVQQFHSMYDRLKNLSPTDFPGELNFFDEFSQFSNWKRKLKEGLERINNKLALFLLNIRLPDLSADNHKYCLNASRVCLYRVFEDLTQENGDKLVNQMSSLGAPMPETDFKCMELYFMFWHISGFLNVDNQEGFERVAESLRHIGRVDLSYSMGYPELRYDRYFFNDNFPVEIYPIRDTKNTGLCLIINQVKYGGKDTDRDSSLVDVGKLKNLMTSLNFSVITLEDVEAHEFCKSIKTTIVEHFSENYSIFMLVVMAHGEKDFIHCPQSSTPTVNNPSPSWHLPFVKSVTHKPSFPNSTTHDNTTINTRGVEVKDIRNSVVECGILNDIPKILIFNACRGGNVFTAKQYPKIQMAADIDVPPVPSHVDIITCYSALPDFVSLRSKDYGSLFINVLCDVLSKRPAIEMCELFTLVNARLMQPTPAIADGFKKGYFGDVHKIANPFEFTSCLTKKLYLKVPEQL